jgi:DNA-binding MurR/RpiR family transcriptional regulator
MSAKGDVFEQIRSQPLTGKKRQVAKYILDNFVEASFLTAAQLAERVQVSEPTVIRLACDLGFRGFPELKDALQEEVQAQLTTVQRLRRARRKSSKAPVVQSLMAEVENLDAVLHSVDVRKLKRVAKRLIDADKVVVIGYKMSSVLADYLSMALKKSIDNNVSVTEATGRFQEELIFAGPKSVVVAISFPRYTMAVVRDFRQAREVGVQTVAITDSELSPLVEYADHFFLAPCRAVSYVDAFGAAIGLLGAIATQVSVMTEDRLIERLAKVERLWEENELFH